MAKFTVKGIDEYTAALERLSDKAEESIKETVYEGAGIIADSVKAALYSIPIDEGTNGLPKYGTPENKLNGVSRKQRADLIESMGLSPIKESSTGIDTKIGWDGYGSVKTKAHPQGVPNVLLMRSIESGTSFMQKTPVIRKAVSKARKTAERAMINKMTEKIEEAMK